MGVMACLMCMGVMLTRMFACCLERSPPSGQQTCFRGYIQWRCVAGLCQARKVPVTEWVVCGKVMVCMCLPAVVVMGYAAVYEGVAMDVGTVTDCWTVQVMLVVEGSVARQVGPRQMQHAWEHLAETAAVVLEV